MKIASKSLLIVGLIAIISYMMQCSCSPGGGTSSSVDFVACGTILEPDGNPAQNIPVAMYPREYLAVPRQLGKHSVENGYDMYSTVTDSKGTYRFERADLISAGVYCIEANDPKNGYCIFIDSIVIDSQLLNSGTWLGIRSPNVNTDNMLKPPGSITGNVQPVNNSDGGIALVYGLNASGVINSDGSFRLDSIPAGNYRLQIIVSHDGNELKSTLAVTAGAGITTTLDTLYGVFYDGNGNTGGTIPSVNNLFNSGDTVIIPGDTGDLEKNDSIFIGWNTNADGSGDWYNPGDTLVIDTTAKMLYAQWATNQHMLTVISSGNGKAGGSDSVAHGVPHAITAIPDSGYHFSGWRVKSGEATIADSFSSSTTIILDRGDATVEGVFKVRYTFQKTFGGSGGDTGYSVLQTSDGGYIIAGSTNSYGAGESDVYLIKTDATGTEVWTKTFGDDYWNIGRSVQNTSDGGYIITGGNGSNIYLIKTNSDGDTGWTRSFQKWGGLLYVETGYSVHQTSDGGYIVSGGLVGSDGNICLIKTNADGDTVWTRKFWTDNWASGSYVQQTNDGGYIVTGSGETDSGQDLYLVKIDPDGALVWEKTFGGSQRDYGTSIQQTVDGGYIITGGTYSFGAGECAIYLIKTTATGDTMWTKKFGGDGSQYGNSIQQTSDGGYIIAGESAPLEISTFVAPQGDLLLIKTNTYGEIIWKKTFGGGYGHRDEGYSVQQTRDGGYIITGRFGVTDRNSDVLLIKTDENGNVE